MARIDFTLYNAAIAADDAYQTELERVYGKARAGDMRYRIHTDPAVIAAHAAKVKADRAWHDAILTGRAGAL